MSSLKRKNHTPDFERKSQKTPDRNTTRVHEPANTNNKKNINLNLSAASKNKETHRSHSSTNRAQTNVDSSLSKQNIRNCSGRKIKYRVEM